MKQLVLPALIWMRFVYYGLLNTQMVTQPVPDFSHSAAVPRHA